jgi:trehalose 6-phosphate synthase/phosphatase
MPTDALDGERRNDIQDRLEHDYDCVTVFPTDSDFDGHYSHYCKTILWPVFHYQIPDHPKSKAYEDHSWVYYVKVNQEFADRIVKSWKKEDIVLIHDYHLLLVPAMIRKKLPDAQIGFFLHVAFPSSEVFRCLAVRNELLEGMLGANLIGFQTQEYCHHFLQTCNRLLCVEATPDGIQLEDRFIDVATFPIGIDPSALSMRREDPEVFKWLQRLQSKYPGKRLIVARDKLDHVRGVRQKLLAYELFLNKYPRHKEEVVMIQVATSTTEQAELDATVSDIVTRINSTHSSLAHQPLVYLKQDIDFTQFLALMTVADALMITSLREGMNLTSHEYLFCQDGKYGDKKHGSLILSEFTGSSSVFAGHELSVNPWDHRQCAEAIRKALEMSAEEREARWTKLMEAVMHHTAEYWFHSFLQRLSKVWKEHSRRDTIAIPRLSVNDLAEKYRVSDRRLFFLDYEGTLAAYGSVTSIVFTSPQRTLDTLTNLLDDPRNIVYVMSGRKPEELDRLFRRVPGGLGLIAENGCFVKEFGTDGWIEMANMEKMSSWKESVGQILRYYKERVEGSWVEERHCSMVFHFNDAVDMAGATRQAGDCANHINDACHSQHVHAVPFDRGLIVESMEWSKGTAATRIFDNLTKQDRARGLRPPQFLMVAGDAREDEVVYRWANQLGRDGVVAHVTTVSVSSRNTEATATLTQGVTGEPLHPSAARRRTARLTRPTGVLSALQKLASPS